MKVVPDLGKAMIAKSSIHEMSPTTVPFRESRCSRGGNDGLALSVPCLVPNLLNSNEGQEGNSVQGRAHQNKRNNNIAAIGAGATVVAERRIGS